ncbi:unnamed protein product [Leuciscus chuanchicus]
MVFRQRLLPHLACRQSHLRPALTGPSSNLHANAPLIELEATEVTVADILDGMKVDMAAVQDHRACDHTDGDEIKLLYTSNRRRQISSVICEWISIPRTKSVQESMSSGRPAGANLTDEASPLLLSHVPVREGERRRGLAIRFSSY